MGKRRFKRYAVVAAGVVAVSGAGTLASGAAPALAATTTTLYTCQGSPVSIALAVPDTAAPGSTVQVTVSAPPGTGSLGLPAAVTSWTGSGTLAVAGDGTTATLPVSYTGGAIASGGVFPGFSVSEPLTMPASGAVTVTMPSAFALTFIVSGLPSIPVGCSTTTPGSDTIHVSGTAQTPPTAAISSVSGETVTTSARDGATVSFTGSGFGSGDTVTASLVPSSGGAAIPLTTTPATITATAAGSVTGSAVIPGSLPAGVYALTFVDPTDNVSASVALTILGTASSTASQTVTTAVSPGPLDLSEAGTTVTLSGITIDGTPQAATGNLNEITVQDFRGSSLGWTLNATATGFTGSNGGSITASALKITPACGPNAAALAASGLTAFPSIVTAGPAATLGTAVTLCSAPAAAAGSLTGGVFNAGGALSLTVPPFLPAGTYTATITFSLG